jgi:hypothetical protein
MAARVQIAFYHVADFTDPDGPAAITIANPLWGKGGWTARAAGVNIPRAEPLEVSVSALRAAAPSSLTIDGAVRFTTGSRDWDTANRRETDGAMTAVRANVEPAHRRRATGRVGKAPSQIEALP